MQTKFTLPVVFLMVLFVMQSCSKDSQQQEVVLNLPAIEEVNATVSGNTSYELKLDDYGTVKISKQASHFVESATGVDVKSGYLRYKYVPLADFKGQDEVELNSTKSITTYTLGGNCNNGSPSTSHTTTSTKLIRIKFTVN
jgi:hypothetical protein